MKAFLPALLLVFCLLFQATGEEKEKPITSDMALKIIEIFRQDPLSEKGKGAASLIMRFTEESDEVVVKLETRHMPWLKTEIDLDISSRLIAAYLAGSVKSQLTKKTKQDDPLAGAEQVIESYQKMRKADPKLRIPSIDTWIKLKSEGKLAEHFAAKEPAEPAAR